MPLKEYDMSLNTTGDNICVRKLLWLSVLSYKQILSRFTSLELRICLKRATAAPETGDPAILRPCPLMEE